MDASKWFSYARSCNYVELERHMDEYAGQTDAEGSTALMIVAEMGAVECVRLLASKEICIVNSAGHTALFLAAVNGHGDVVDILGPLEAKTLTSNGEDALMLAARTGSSAAVPLLSPYIDLLPNKDGLTALELAINNDAAGFVLALIEARSLPPSTVSSALQYAISKHAQRCTDVLKRAMSIKAGQLNIGIGKPSSRGQALQPMAPLSDSPAKGYIDTDDPTTIMKALSKTARPMSAGSIYAGVGSDRNFSGVTAADMNMVRSQQRPASSSAARYRAGKSVAQEAGNDVSMSTDTSVLQRGLAAAQRKIAMLEEQILERNVADSRAHLNEYALQIKQLTDLKNRNAKMLDDMQNHLADAIAATKRVECKLMVAERLAGENAESAMEAHNTNEIALRDSLAYLQQQQAFMEARSERQGIQLESLCDTYHKMSVQLVNLWYQLPPSKNPINVVELLSKPDFLPSKDELPVMERSGTVTDELFTWLYHKICLLADSLVMVITDAIPMVEASSLNHEMITGASEAAFYRQSLAALKAELLGARAIITERESMLEKERASVKQLQLRMQELSTFGLSNEQHEPDLIARAFQLEAQCTDLQAENMSLKQDLAHQAALLKHSAKNVSASDVITRANVKMYTQDSDLERLLAEKDIEIQKLREEIEILNGRSKTLKGDAHEERQKLLNEIYCLRDILYGEQGEINEVLKDAASNLKDPDLSDPLDNKRLIKTLRETVISLARTLRQESLKRITVSPDSLELQDRILALEREKTALMKDQAKLRKDLHACEQGAEEARRAAEAQDKHNSMTIQTLRSDYDGLQRRCAELLKAKGVPLPTDARGIPKSATDVLSSLHNATASGDFLGPSFTSLVLDAATEPPRYDHHNLMVTEMGIVESVSATRGHYAYTVAAVQTDPCVIDKHAESVIAELDRKNLELSKKLLGLDQELNDAKRALGAVNDIDLNGMTLREYVEAHKKQDQSLTEAKAKLAALQKLEKDHDKTLNENRTLEAKCQELQAELGSLRARIDNARSEDSNKLTIKSTSIVPNVGSTGQAPLPLTPLNANILAQSSSKPLATSIADAGTDDHTEVPHRSFNSSMLVPSSRLGESMTRTRPSSSKMGAMINNMEHNMLAMASLQSSRNGSRANSRTNSRSNSRGGTQSRPLSGSAFGRSSMQSTAKMDGSMVNSSTLTSSNARMYIRSNSNRRYSSTAFGGPGHISEFCARPERPRSPAAVAANKLHSREVALNLGPNSRTPYSTPLMDAVVRRDMFGVESEMGHAGMQKTDGTTALMLAITCNFPEAIPLLMNVEAGMKKDNGDTALSLAVRAEMYDIARLLTPREGLDISGYSKENNRITELMVAAAKNDVYTVWCLRSLQGGLTDLSGRTALMYAAKRSAVNCLKILDAEVGLKDNNGETALMMAASMGLVEVVKVLAPLEHSIQTPVHHPSGHKCTALMLAILNNHLHVCHYLAPYEGGLRDEDNQSALDYLLANKSAADSDTFQRVRALLMQCC
ncbi:Ankyrin repeat protein 1 [Giardia duodenalis]|uniref:Ankyrin repeat protein 1 n=1 Tax=Giardia intestinalis (strain ATCC 50803 / WB clone C6) TaxID=184922 RepID=A8BKY7_GIAIC|nr:Ankyrin repeat protein 1 [Giardia intestinalis]KAE8301604.1 Ankyrin repeat protein 1 [Giardia intestinalis]|eukprot:XP_001706379.1 Protein 21.1 [Giardia lamblia ATCC 50803]